jgi:hypothetical protein
LDHAVTAKQKEILKAFGVQGVSYVKSQTAAISEELANLKKSKTSYK